MTLASHVHLDPLGGIAGDMFVAALLDAFPALEKPLIELLDSLRTPVPVVVTVSRHSDHALQGRHFSVRLRDSAPGHGHAHPHEHTREHTHAHGEYARHGHMPHSKIVEWLRAAALTDAVRAHAIGMFAVLAEAEAAVHGVPLDQVEFHEVGAWDSIVDVVAAAFLIDAVGAAAWSVAPLPMGSGLVKTAHGMLPIPAPATALLTRGMSLFDDGIPGERVTPTGAAVLRHLGASARGAGSPSNGMVLSATGFGFGTRRLPDRANALRCLAFTAESGDAGHSSDEAVNCIAFEIDDQSSEDLAAGLDVLRAQPGVLQVMQIPAFGKKGRMAVKVEIVATFGATDDVVRHCFRQTTTIGLRVTPAQRRVLSRTIASPDHPGHARVKLVQRGDALTAKAEMDDLAAAGGGHAERERMRRASEAQALISSRAPHESK